MSERDDFLLRDGSQGIDSRKEQFGKPVLVLLLLVTVVLLVACANLAALLLVRSVERTREAGVRVAIGASRSALLRQFLAESLMLAAAGGIAGWILALALIRILLSLLGTQGEGLTHLVTPNATVFAFSAVTTLGAGLVFGVLPAWRAARADPLPAIHGAVIAGPGRRSLISRLVIAGQIALSMALLFCAGLFAQTLRNLRSVDLGFHTENVIVFPIDLGRTAFRETAAPFFRELLRRAGELPETRAASLTRLSVVSGSLQSIIIAVPGYAAANGLRPMSYFTRVSGGYFRTLGIPILQGQDFAGAETDDGVLVNEQFARQFFGGEALGKTLSYGSARGVRVIGVVGTAKFRYIREEPQPVMYLPLTQRNFPGFLFLQVRTAGGLARTTERLRAIVSDLGPRVPLDNITTMEMQVDAALARERLLAFLSTLMGAVAAALAAIGLYGALSFAVTRRTREIGIRLSVGAPRSRILMLFLGDSAWTVLCGIAAGIPLVLGCGALASSLLYGVKGQDIGTMLGAVAMLALISFIAALLPAARAARVDPIRALRHE